MDESQQHTEHSSLSGVFSDHNEPKEAINKRNPKCYMNMCGLNNLFLNETWITEEIKSKTQIFLEIMENGCTVFQTLLHIPMQYLEEVYISQCLHF